MRWARKTYHEVREVGKGRVDVVDEEEKVITSVGSRKAGRKPACEGER